MSVSQPYDQQSKILLDEEKRAGLFLFIGLALDDPTEVEALQREVLLAAKHVDHAFKLTRDGFSCIENLEATTAYSTIDFDAVYDRATILEVKNKIGVRTRHLLMTGRGMPAEPRREHVIFRRGGNGRRTYTVEYIHVRELPGRLVFVLDRPALYPWVVLMDSTPEEQAEALHRIRLNRDMVARYAVLFHLRYGKKEDLARLEKDARELFDQRDHAGISACPAVADGRPD